AGNPVMDRLAQNGFENRQEHHQQQCRCDTQIFNVPGNPPPAGWLGGLKGDFRVHFFARYSARSFSTSSNNSAGTTAPRIFGYAPSTTLRHAASAAGVNSWTIKPRFFIASTDSVISLRACARISLPAFSAASSRAFWLSGASLSHVFLDTTAAP